MKRKAHNFKAKTRVALKSSLWNSTFEVTLWLITTGHHDPQHVSDADIGALREVVPQPPQPVQVPCLEGLLCAED